MAKLGDEYEELVAAVQRALDPGASVEVGQWVTGPDGRRDMDVAVRGSVGGAQRLALIECKDWQGPVGIGVIDALDSKRRDLSADVALVYSSSGFTDQAERKAARVGIGLASVVAAGHPRVRGRLYRKFVARRVTCERLRLVLYPPEGGSLERLPEFKPDEVLYDGKPVLGWVDAQIPAALKSAPQGRYVRADIPSRQPLAFTVAGEEVSLVGIGALFERHEDCVSQTVQVDLTLGLFDHLTKRVTVPDQQGYMLGPIDNEAWEVDDCPPPEAELEPGTFDIGLTIYRTFAPELHTGAADLNPFVQEAAVVAFDSPAG